MLGFCIALAMQLADTRVLDDVNVWQKPAKFFLSLSVFSLTAAWFIGDIEPSYRSAFPVNLVASLIIIAGSFELFWITWQAAHAARSHFNAGTPLASAMVALMGIGAITLML